MTAQTIFALSSGRPPAGIAVIRISGPEAHDAGVALAGSLPEARTAAVRELRNPKTQETLDQALVLRFDAPASATGESVVELHCHGGRAVVDAVMKVLGAVPGLREAGPGEFTRRAFANGRIDLTEAEGLADLIEAETEIQRRAALAVAGGGLRRQIELWQDSLLGLSASAERAIDYDEEDEALDPVLVAGCTELANELETWLNQPRAEPLKHGVRVVVAGPPNAGKSSLINALAGDDRAIVTDVPGTTRDVIEVPMALDGIPIMLTDTAGLRESDDPIEAIGIERAVRLVSASELLLWLGAPDLRPPHGNVVQIAPKADLGRAIPSGAHAVSALTGKGLPELKKLVAARSRALLPGEDAIALNRRQAELIATASDAVGEAARQTDIVIAAEHLRHARDAFDRVTGQSGVEDLLDLLFGRFCLGK